MLSILHDIHRHSILRTRRSPLWGQGRWAHVVMWTIWSLGLLYLAFIGVLLAFTVRDNSGISGYEFMCGILPFILVVDFLLRIIFKQNPSQAVKPYLLLPISKFAVTDCLLIEDLLSPYNLIWQALFVPFAVLTILPQNDILTFLLFVIAMQCIIEINSLWFLLVRSLTSKSLCWIVLPIGVYALVALPYFTTGGINGIIAFCGFYSTVGKWLSFHQLILWPALLGIIVLLFFINRIVEHIIIRSEIFDDNSRSYNRFSFGNGVSFIFSRSTTAMLMKFEVVAILRNKNLRQTLITIIAMLVAISAVLTFTNVFSDRAMLNFWLFYCFELYGTMYLVKIMCYDGNYIDAIAVSRIPLTSILKAKYILSVIMLIVPFVILLPTVFTGKYSLYDLISYMLLAAGAVHFGYFQLAPYNNHTIALDTKRSGQGGARNNYTQMVAAIIIFSIPITLITILEASLGHVMTDTIVASIGIIFIAASNFWIQNIASRMESRKYTNLETFKQTRLKD